MYKISRRSSYRLSFKFLCLSLVGVSRVGLYWGLCVEGVVDCWIRREHSLSIQFTANKKKKSRISIRRYRYTHKEHMRLSWIWYHTHAAWKDMYEMNASLTRRHMRHATGKWATPSKAREAPRYICISLPQSCLSSRCRILIRFRISATAPRSHSAKPENRNGTKREMKWNEMLQLQLQAAAAAAAPPASACQAAI